MTRLLALGLLAAAAAMPYTRSTTEAGIPLVRPDATAVQFLVHTSVRAGAQSSDGVTAITADSDPVAAIAAAAVSWSGVAESKLRFLPVQETTLLNNPGDGQHVIHIVDNDEARSIAGSYLAMTVWSYSVADGAITDTDMVLNARVLVNGGRVPFSTTRQTNTYDLQSVVTHEFGHALGANHTGVISSAMFQTTNPFSPYVSTVEATMQAWVAPGDVAFVIAAYPGDGVEARFGRIEGKVRFDGGAGVKGPLVVAANPATGVLISVPGSMTDGAFSIAGIPAGTYYVYAQPLDGPLVPATIGLPNSASAEMFRTTFFGGNQAPTAVEVAAGAAQSVEIVVDPAAPAMHINQLGVGSVGGNDWSYAATRAISSGRSWDVLLWCKGIDPSVRPVQVAVLGPGVTIREGSFRMQTTAPVGGVVPLRFTVDVAGREARAQVAIAVIDGTDAAANTASLLLLPGGFPQ